MDHAFGLLVATARYCPAPHPSLRHSQPPALDTSGLYLIFSTSIAAFETGDPPIEFIQLIAALML
jgi:hypothetical protein